MHDFSSYSAEVRTRIASAAVGVVFLALGVLSKCGLDEAGVTAGLSVSGLLLVINAFVDIALLPGNRYRQAGITGLALSASAFAIGLGANASDSWLSFGAGLLATGLALAGAAVAVWLVARGERQLDQPACPRRMAGHEECDENTG